MQILCQVKNALKIAIAARLGALGQGASILSQTHSLPSLALARPSLPERESKGERMEKAGMNVRDYSPPQDGFAPANLIQSPSRIKRASRHVSFIRIQHR
jgi:hypothetical protein